MKKINPGLLMLAVFLILYTAYSAAFIYKSSEVIAGKRHFILFDDMMISMRYAKNFADGNGLVWNPGRERVEGYTNFLWTLYMAVPHLLKYQPSKTSLFIQISGWMLMVLTLLVVYRTALLMTENNPVIAAGAVILCGMNFSLTQWALIGTEVSLLAFLVSVAVHEIAALEKERRIGPVLYVVLALMVLTRIDMIVMASVIAVFSAVFDKQGAKYRLLRGMTVILAAAAALTVFRVLYYHDIMPNTYYLKMTGYPVLLRLARGLWSFTGMIARSWAVPFIFPLAYFFIIKDKMFRFILALFMAQSLYSVYIGGDAWHNGVGVNRFIAAVFPVFFIAVSISVYNALGFLKNRGITGKAAFFAVISSFVFLFNFYQGTYSISKALLRKPALDQEAGKRLLYDSYLINAITDKDAVIAVLMAGVVPYFTGRECIDMLGKSDRHIARVPMMTPGKNAPLWDKITFFYPGHLKADYAYSIGLKKPDLICGSLKISTNVDTAGYSMLSNYMFLRRDSKKIKMEILNEIISKSDGRLKYM